jgi:hypothetical protein
MKTARMFRRLLAQTSDIEKAASQSVYSGMRDNLYDYLHFVGLFDWLGEKHPYWEGTTNKRLLWDRMFSDLESSRSCGIQMTQVVNCAILRGTNSSEPTKEAFDEVNAACPKCFFGRFIVTDSLRLVVFFDTPFDDRFHQIDYWPASDNGKKAQDVGVKVISITHPSSENNEIHKHLPEITGMSREAAAKTRVVRAARLLEQAMKTIAELRAE